MSQNWMFTCKRTEVIDCPWGEQIEHRITVREIRRIFKANDCHKWVVGIEEGADGYQHYQGRFCASRDDTFEWCKNHIGILHLEKAETWCDYECKEGHFIQYDDFTEQLKTRFGKPRAEQLRMMRELQKQSVREVDVWFDAKGCIGKSWLCNWAYETRQAWYIPPTLKSVQAMIQDTCSKMSKEKRPIVIIDIPRSWKWSDELYTAIEVIKDGLVDDPRYSAQTINIRGVKVLCLTNSMPKLDALSQDRWLVNGYYQGGPWKGTTRKKRAFIERERRELAKHEEEYRRVLAGEDPRTPPRLYAEGRGTRRG